MCQPGRKSASRSTERSTTSRPWRYSNLQREVYVFRHMHWDIQLTFEIYLEYGKNCPQFLEGMFAFAIWDDEQQLLFMARDRFGKKPLYFGARRAWAPDLWSLKSRRYLHPGWSKAAWTRAQ